MEREEKTETSFVDRPAEVGALIRYQRVSRMLTQADLAGMAGVGRRLVVDVEAGKDTVQASMLFKLCHALDMELMVKRILPCQAVPLGHAGVGRRYLSGLDPRRKW
jgi:HTH-type transcriptional regulator/antitoxin HipB